MSLYENRTARTLGYTLPYSPTLAFVREGDVKNGKRPGRAAYRAKIEPFTVVVQPKSNLTRLWKFSATRL